MTNKQGPGPRRGEERGEEEGTNGEERGAYSSSAFGRLCPRCLRSRQILGCDNQKENISIKRHHQTKSGHR
jgi:hypothetical protein